MAKSRPTTRAAREATAIAPETSKGGENTRRRTGTPATEGAAWGVRTDGVKVAGGPEGAHYVAHHHNQDRSDNEHPRDVEDGLITDPYEAVRDTARVDLDTVDEDGVHTPDDVERAQGDHKARYTGKDDYGAVDDAAQQAHADSGEEAQDDRKIGEMSEDIADDIGGKAEHGTYRKVDVAGDYHHGLAHGKDHHHRSANEQLLDAEQVGETRIVRSRQPEDGQFNEPKDSSTSRAWKTTVARPAARARACAARSPTVPSLGRRPRYSPAAAPLQPA